MWKSALERCKKKIRVCCLKSAERGHDYIGIAKADGDRIRATFGLTLDSRERETLRLREYLLDRVRQNVRFGSRDDRHSNRWICFRSIPELRGSHKRRYRLNC